MLLCLPLVWLGSLARGATDYDRLLSTLTQRWGNTPVPKFQAWRALIAAASAAPVIIGDAVVVGGVASDDFSRMNQSLARLERFWTDQIKYRL